MTVIPQARPFVSAPPRWLDHKARRAIHDRLAGLQGGRITVEDFAGTSQLGSGPGARVTLRIRDPRVYRQVAWGGTLAAGEAYIRGQWECDDLLALLRLFVRNLDNPARLDHPLTRIAQWGHRILHRLRGNTKRGSRANIHAHYDLGNEFFGLILDETLAYSSGIFHRQDATLREASLEKFDRACRKLNLQAQDHLLEIGTGWGGLALHAARQYGCRVTTTTISQQQFLVARQKIAEAGLADRVTVIQRDYRELTGQFDKLISIEMVEAVGHEHLDAYFAACGRLLKPQGSMVLQAIIMPERRYEQYLRSVDFIQRYIFPGGCLPAMAAMLTAVGRATDLRFVHSETFGSHYAMTLQEWRRRFHEQLPDVRRLGLADDFIRMWDYYLAYCEAAFEQRAIDVAQLVFAKPGCADDPLQITERAAAARHHVAGKTHEATVRTLGPRRSDRITIAQGEVS